MRAHISFASHSALPFSYSQDLNAFFDPATIFNTQLMDPFSWNGNQVLGRLNPWAMMPQLETSVMKIDFKVRSCHRTTTASQVPRHCIRILIITRSPRIQDT